jgi:hypothetical protein
MKNIFYILLLTTQVFFAQNEKEECFVKKGKYEQAIDAYGSVLKTKAFFRVVF